MSEDARIQRLEERVAHLEELVGVLVGLPALRMRGLYLALLTLGIKVRRPVAAATGSTFEQWAHERAGEER